MRQWSANKRHRGWQQNAGDGSVRRRTSAEQMRVMWQLRPDRRRGRGVERWRPARNQDNAVATIIEGKMHRGIHYARPQPTLTGQGKWMHKQGAYWTIPSRRFTEMRLSVRRAKRGDNACVNVTAG